MVCLMNYFTPTVADLCVCNGLGIFQEADWKLDISLFNSDDEHRETSIDLSGFEGSGLIRIDDEKTIDIDVSIDNINQIHLFLDSSITSTIPTKSNKFYEISRYPYEITIEKGEEKYRLLNGFVEVSPTITKGI